MDISRNLYYFTVTERHAKIRGRVRTDARKICGPAFIRRAKNGTKKHGSGCIITPVPCFLAIVSLGIFRSSGHRVNVSPGTAACGVQFFSFLLRHLPDRDIWIHIKHLFPVSKYPGSIVSGNPVEYKRVGRRLCPVREC